MSLASLPRQPPMKRRRRTATSVFAGDFDPRPPRDVLTSLLNGVGPYKLVEKEDEERRVRRQERRERKKDKRREKREAKRGTEREDRRGALFAADATKGLGVATSESEFEGPRKVLANAAAREARQMRLKAEAEAAALKEHEAKSESARGKSASGEPAVNNSTSSFWRSRGPAIVPTRSVSPSPPPPGHNSPPTPGPSISSTVSRTSSKRPLTPDDYDFYSSLLDVNVKDEYLDWRPRKKRAAARKGWKGWVEGSPPPSDKLINLDTAPVMQERRTRSGKNFDAISEGHEMWVNVEH